MHVHSGHLSKLFGREGFGSSLRAAKWNKLLPLSWPSVNLSFGGTDGVKLKVAKDLANNGPAVACGKPMHSKYSTV